MTCESSSSQPTANSHPTEPSVEAQIARVFEWRRGFNAMHLTDLGVQLGLFHALDETPDVTPAEIAQRLNLHAPYVDTWCTTAYSFGLLEGSEDRRFRLAAHIDQIFAKPGHPRYLGGFVRLGTEFATEDHRFCLEAFKTGAIVPFQGRSEHFAEVIAQSTAGLQILSARKLLPELSGLQARLDEGGSILEVGCGAGRHLLHLAKAFPKARCIGIDIDPTGLRAARHAIETAGLAGRVSVLEGDIGSQVDAESVDAVVMIEVLHEIGKAFRQQVIDGCFRALRAGGWLLIVDETYPGSLAEARLPEFLFPVQTGFEELTWGNVVPDRREQEALLRRAGFTGSIGRSVIGEGFTVLSVLKLKMESQERI